MIDNQRKSIHLIWKGLPYKKKRTAIKMLGYDPDNFNYSALSEDQMQKGLEMIGYRVVLTK